MPKAIRTLVMEDLEARRQRLGARKKFMDGDHWQNAQGWVGPRPVITESTTSAEQLIAQSTMLAIEKAFVRRNIVKEAAKRHRDGVVGREVQWKLTPAAAAPDDSVIPPETKALIDEAEAALTTWWDENGAPSALSDAILKLAWAGTDEHDSAALLRLFIPPDKITGDGTIPTPPDLAGSFDALGINALEPLMSGALRDTNDQLLAAYYAYKDDDERDVLELVLLERRVDDDLRVALAQAQRDAVRVPDLAVDGDRAVVVVQRSGAVTGVAAYDLGGRLPMFELRREPLITDSAIDLQKHLNMAYTMMGRNVVQAGFLERIVSNAQVPGQWVDADGNATSSDSDDATFQPAPFKTGAGTTQFLAGIPVRDPTGKITGYTSPNVVYRDPVTVTTFLDTIDAIKSAFYSEVQQLHTQIAGDATPSGQSRAQAAEDFAMSLQDTAKRVERATRWLLETALAWAALLRGQAGRFEALRVSAEARITAAQPTTSDKADAVALKDARIISDETAMSWAGVEDVDAEKAKKEREFQQDAAKNPPPPGAIPSGAQNPEQAPGAAPAPSAAPTASSAS